MENNGSVSSPVVTWEAHKAVMRGSLIAKITGKRKEKTRELEGRLRDLEEESGYGASNTPQHQIDLTRDRYRKLVDGVARLQGRAC